jgi:ribosomal protein S18 acetylase RimI-like enzyme
MTEINLATKDDAQIIALLGRITFTESHSQFIQNNEDVKTFCNTTFEVAKIKKELQDKNLLFWIILNDNLPVGFAKVILHKPNPFINSTNICQLDKIYILNDFLGMKLGHKLHSALINHVKQLKFDAVWLITYIHNYDAIKFYESRQYKKAGFINFLVTEKDYKNHILVKTLKE